jgi:hypothetical protein
MPIRIKSIKRDSQNGEASGRSTPKPEKESLRVLPNPTYAGSEDPALNDEEQVTRCEIGMAKGIRDRAKLQELLGEPDSAKVDVFVARVHTRWESGGCDRNIARCRGEELASLQAQSAWLWESLDELERPAGFDARGLPVRKRTYLKEFLHLIDAIRVIIVRSAAIQGLTKEVVHGLLDRDIRLHLNLLLSEEVLVKGQQIKAMMFDMVEERLKKEETTQTSSVIEKFDLQHDEEQVSKCEKLMMNGVRDPSQLRSYLGEPDLANVNKFIARVHNDWEIVGSGKNIVRFRGEAVASLRALEAKLLDKIEATKHPLAFDARGNRVEQTTNARDLPQILGELRKIEICRNEIQGLTQVSIKELLRKDPTASLNFNRSPEVFARAQQVAAVMLELVEKKMADEEASRSLASPREGEETDGPVGGR